MSIRMRVATYRVPLSSTQFRRLWWAQLASELGDAAGRIALAVLVTERSGTPLAAGAVLAISVIPYLGLGQWITAWCERFPRREVLIVADIVRAVCFVTMALDVPLWVRFLLLFVASTASPPFESVRNALVPSTLPPEQLTDGIALQVLTNEMTRLAGLVLGGVGATLATPGVALTMNATTFLVSALLLAGLPRETSAGELRQAVRLRDSWEFIRHDGLIRRIAWMSPGLVAFGAVPEALVVPYTDEVLGRSSLVAGVLAALVSLSILVLAPLLPRAESHRGLVRQAAGAAVLGGAVATVAFAAPTHVVVAAIAFASIGPVFVGRINLGAAMSLRLPDHLRASTFSLVDGFISVGQVVAGLGGGWLAAAAGPRTAFVVAMLLTTLCGAAAYVAPIREHARVRAGG